MSCPSIWWTCRGGCARDTRRQRVTYHDSCHMLRELPHPRSAPPVPSSVATWLRASWAPTAAVGSAGRSAVRYPEVSAAMADDKLASSTGRRGPRSSAADPGCLCRSTAGRPHRAPVPVDIWPRCWRRRCDSFDRARARTARRPRRRAAIAVMTDHQVGLPGRRAAELPDAEAMRDVVRRSGRKPIASCHLIGAWRSWSRWRRNGVTVLCGAAAEAVSIVVKSPLSMAADRSSRGSRCVRRDRAERAARGRGGGGGRDRPRGAHRAARRRPAGAHPAAPAIHCSREDAGSCSSRSPGGRWVTSPKSSSGSPANTCETGSNGPRRHHRRELRCGRDRHGRGCLQ